MRGVWVPAFAGTTDGNGTGLSPIAIDPSVVPAKAGTHSHRRQLRNKVSPRVPKRSSTAYGSRRSPGRRKLL